MHILELPDDLLLNVGSLLLPLLFEPRYAFTYCTDYLERRPVFRKLVRVCRRFYGLFTPSLYRTLHLIYEECNYSEESRERWYGLNAQRRTTRALLRTLESELPHRTYVHNLELVWDVSRDGNMP